MNEYYFLVNSITTAMKGEELLKNSGRRAYVLRDSKINPFGCGYVIRAFGDANEIYLLLRGKGIKVLEIREAK